MLILGKQAKIGSLVYCKLASCEGNRSTIVGCTLILELIFEEKLIIEWDKQAKEYVSRGAGKPDSPETQGKVGCHKAANAS